MKYRLVKLSSLDPQFSQYKYRVDVKPHWYSRWKPYRYCDTYQTMLHVTLGGYHSKEKILIEGTA